ncbi:hypothetical protein ACFTXM_42970 [Streptomyces sp. NPDC056930]|uniref:hypothetical protein n=1 Tax=Streptomyces sp. NPDC056930 TaxID=3345967 RepID=UPI00362E1788
MKGASLMLGAMRDGETGPFGLYGTAPEHDDEDMYGKNETAVGEQGPGKAARYGRTRATTPSDRTG